MIILASQSPRRQELLRRVVPLFDVHPASIDERALPLLPPPDYVLSLAQAKGEAVAKQFSTDLVIAADTMVAFGDQLLGKPKDAAAARAMLHELAGQTHSVWSAVSVRVGQQEAHLLCETQVSFWPLSEAEITAYIATGEYKDKAGSYGIQGQGALLVKQLQGDYYNVVGLPISALARLLRDFEPAQSMLQ